MLWCNSSAPPLTARFENKGNLRLGSHNGCCSVLWCESFAPPTTGRIAYLGNLRFCSQNDCCSKLWCERFATPTTGRIVKNDNLRLFSHKACYCVLWCESSAPPIARQTRCLFFQNEPFVFYTAWQTSVSRRWCISAMPTLARVGTRAKGS